MTVQWKTFGFRPPGGSLCGAHAIVELPPALKAEQPDDTTHVCLPAVGGCNHGFAKD